MKLKALTLMEGKKMRILDAVEAVEQIGTNLKLEPFSKIIDPLIEETLAEHKKNKDRKGTILTGVTTVWLVLALTLRRDLNCIKVLEWMFSGFRWVYQNFPQKIVKEGAISHARKRLGVDVFKDIFNKLVSGFTNVADDFHGYITVMFDGTSMTMPDTKKNRKRFKKHTAGRGNSAFPQLRLVALMIMSGRRIFDIAYAPYKGKKTGEKTLMFEILKRCKRKDFMFLFDAGFYSFFSYTFHER